MARMWKSTSTNSSVPKSPTTNHGNKWNKHSVASPNPNDISTSTTTMKWVWMWAMCLCIHPKTTTLTTTAHSMKEEPAYLPPTSTTSTATPPNTLTLWTCIKITVEVLLNQGVHWIEPKAKSTSTPTKIQIIVFTRIGNSLLKNSKSPTLRLSLRESWAPGTDLLRSSRLKIPRWR